MDGCLEKVSSLTDAFKSASFGNQVLKGKEAKREGHLLYDRLITVVVHDLQCLKLLCLGSSESNLAAMNGQ